MQLSSSVAGTKETVVRFIKATMVLIEGGCDSRGLYFIVYIIKAAVHKLPIDFDNLILRADCILRGFM